ncbi:MAG TPA: hypothetical protein DEA08_04795 [Planctomycetes bacterium]|nr:hypothetical protein [Planctomycetota bacterium]
MPADDDDPAKTLPAADQVTLRAALEALTAQGPFDPARSLRGVRAEELTEADPVAELAATRPLEELRLQGPDAPLRLGVLLGSGGMGEVWRATHRMLARPAAIKLIRPEALSGRASATQRQTLKARFEREARATAQLSSPHTISIYDFGATEDGVLYYVMELLDGTDLETLVAEHGPLPAGRVVHLLKQACESLAEAHRAGLVHRDVKPANLFLARKGRRVDWVKVLDFGLVKEREATSAALTADGELAGTPAYLAPEVATGDAPVDGRADLYALGCVAYALLTGAPVFEGVTAMQVAAAHVVEAPAPPSTRTRALIPRDLEALILACLAKAPADRPASAADLRDALRATGLSSGWTAKHARAWWDTHLAPESSGVFEAAPPR